MASTISNDSLVRGAALAIAFALSGACSSPPENIESARWPIVGGTNAPTCAWPTVVLVGGDCSGTLVQPQVVITAAHCVNGGEVPVPKSIAFGENALNSPTRTVNVSRCAPSPKYNGGDTDDIGYCLLAQPITDMPLVPAMAACEATALKAGADIMEVGFGQSAVMTGQNDGFGIKRFTSAKINAIASNGRINVTTGSQNGEYFGDSGGPIFFQMPDQTWRLIGADCCAPDIVVGSTAPRISTYTSVPLNLAWLETSSGVDLTPCHDGSSWNPSALCSALPTTPDEASGGWTTLCSSTQAPIAPQATCTTSGDAGGGSSDAGGISSDGGAGGSRIDAGGAGGNGGSAGGPRGTGGAGGAGGSTSPEGGAGAAGRNGAVGTDGGARDGAGATGSGGNGNTGTSGAGGSTDGGDANDGSGGISGSGGAKPGSGGAVPTADAAAPPDSSGGSDEGCSCNLAARSTSVPWHATLAALALASLRRRRRTRR